MQTAKSIAYTSLAIVLLFLAIAWGNTLWRQHAQFQAGEDALKRGDFILAIAGYESAIHMYTPGSSTVDKAASRLFAIGNYFDKAGETEKALVAFRALRSSFYAAHWFTTPGKDWIRRCDEKIAGLLGKEKSAASGQKPAADKP